MTITIRRFQQKDFACLLALANQAVPFDPDGNRAWLEHRKRFEARTLFRRHFIAEETGEPAGYGCLEQQGPDPQHLRTFVVCRPDRLGSVGSRLFDRLIQSARDACARSLWAREYLADQAIRSFFSERGFEERDRFTLDGQLPMVVLHLEL